MALNCKTPEDVLAAIKEHEVQIVDVRFTDLPGTWQHFSLPAGKADADIFSEGIGFDGSSMRRAFPVTSEPSDRHSFTTSQRSYTSESTVFPISSPK